MMASNNPLANNALFVQQIEAVLQATTRQYTAFYSTVGPEVRRRLRFAERHRGAAAEMTNLQY